MRSPHFLALLALLPGCGSSDDDFTDCRIGSLTGTWRIHYEEQDPSGSAACGELPDTTVSFDSGDDGSCKDNSRTLAADKCRVDFDFTCPFSAGGKGPVTGTVRYVGVTKQTGEGSLSSEQTITVTDSTIGTCVSTYEMTYTKL